MHYVTTQLLLHHNRFTALWILSGPTRVSRHQKGKTNLDLLEQETVIGSGISWSIWKSAPCSRQITTPAPHHSVFYRPDALPATQPTASQHWRHIHHHINSHKSNNIESQLIEIEKQQNTRKYRQ